MNFMELKVSSGPVKDYYWYIYIWYTFLACVFNEKKSTEFSLQILTVVFGCVIWHFMIYTKISLDEYIRITCTECAINSLNVERLL